MADDIGLLEWAFKGGVTGCVLAGAWLWRGLVGDLKELGGDMTATKQALNDHKLTVSENYAKKIELTPIYNKLDDVQNDIKILIGRKQEQDR